MELHYFDKHQYMAVFISLSLSAVAFAGDPGNIDITLTNQTGNECQLISKKVMHGILQSPVPLSLSANQSATFTIHRTIITSDWPWAIFTSEARDSSYDADMIFTYQCKGIAPDTSARSVQFEIVEAGLCNRETLDHYYYAAPVTNAPVTSFKMLKSEGLIAEVASNLGCYKRYHSEQDEPARINLNLKYAS